MINGQFLLAIPVMAALMAVPGYSIATLIVPGWRWWERVLMVPGLATGLVGIVGLVFHDLRVPFEPLTVFPVLALPAGAVAVVSARRGPSVAGTRHGQPRVPRESLFAGAAVAAGVVTVGLFVYGIHSEILPAWNDLTTHAAVTRAIVRSHDVLPVIPTAVNHSGYVRLRMGIEATAALGAALTSLPVATLLTAIAILASTLLPVGLLRLAQEATGSIAVGALAALMGMGMLLPVDPLVFGEYPLLVDATLVPALIVGALGILRCHEPRRCAILIGVCTGAIWVGHGLEFITAGAIGAGLVVPELVALIRARPRALAGAISTIALAAMVGAGIVTVLTRAPFVPAPIQLPGGLLDINGAILTPRPESVSGLDRLLPAVLVAMPSVPMFPLWLAGAAWAARFRSRLTGLAIVSLLLMLAFFDVSTRLRLRPLWRAVFPWGAGDRLLGIEYWAVPLVIAAGLTWLLGSGRRMRGHDEALIRNLLSSTFVAVVLGVTLAGVVLSLKYEARVVRSETDPVVRATAADVAVLQEMGRILPAGAVVLTNGNDDAGVWVDEVTPQVPFINRELAVQYPDDAHVVAVAHACVDHASAMRALADVDAIFIGSRPVRDVRHPWDLACIGRLANLRRIAVSDSGGAVAAAFQVVK